MYAKSSNKALVYTNFIIKLEDFQHLPFKFRTEIELHNILRL